MLWSEISATRCASNWIFQQTEAILRRSLVFRQGLGVEPWRTSNGYNKKPTGSCELAERHSSGYFGQTTQVTSPMASLSKETSSTDFRPNWVEKDVGCWNVTSRLRLTRPRCSVRS